MKLLITTQVVDLDHPVLGFFHDWIAEFAKHIERIEVICLYKGRVELPDNVRVHSLGKEKGRRSAPVYAAIFLMRAWKLRRKYDAAFVHMNQEYVLLAGLLWKALGKPIYMWRNHYAGSLLTDIAVALCTKVFCTSRHSYTAKFKKAELMPVGVDVGLFFPSEEIERRKNSVLFLARMSPSKNPLMLLDALKEMRDEGIPFTATLVGSPLPEHEAYYRSVVGRAEQYGLKDQVTFLPGVPKDEAPDLYRAHEVFVNTSPSGMFDKTIFEAAATGALSLARSDDWQALAGEAYSFRDARELAERLKGRFALLSEEKGTESLRMRSIAESHGLPFLAARLTATISR